MYVAFRSRSFFLVTYDVFADVIWSIVVVITTSSAYSVPCASDSNIWLYSLVAVIIAPVVGSVVSAINSAFKETAGYLQVIPLSMTLFMAVWGVLLWANMSERCNAFYDEAYWALYLVFKINVILLIIGFVVILIALCGVLVALCIALASVSGRPDRYENIPDSIDEINRTAGASSGRDTDPQRSAQASNIPETETYV
jgi:hypothetical protein